MVKKSSSKDTANTQSTQPGGAAKSEHLEAETKIAPKQKRKAAEKTLPQSTAAQHEDTVAAVSEQLPQQAEVRRVEENGLAAAEKPVAETHGELLAHEVPQASDAAPKAQTAPTESATANAAEPESVYLEPEMPIILEPSPGEEAESVNPPIPEELQPPEEPGMLSEPAAVEHRYEPPGPQYPSMFVVQITPELAPLAKVGGLADVVTGLSRELELRGNSVEIILPKYDCMRYDHIWGLCKTFDDLWVPWYDGHIRCTVWFGFVHGRKCFFIEPHSQDRFFNRGSIYGFDDDILRFAFFSRAAVEFLWKAGKHPEIIHCHDWQTALVPVYLYEIYKHMGMSHPRVCFTIHNFKHQGVTGDFMLRATGLHRPEYYFHRDRLLDNHIPHALNLMKGGIVYSNFVTTVSPRYAGETKDGGQGFGLEPTLHAHHYKYGGIVNGIDYDAWNPEIDPHIPVHYNVDTIDGKYGNKHALRNRLLLADNAKPIIAFVGRLDPQKGLDLVRHALFYALNHAAQFVLLGSSPEGGINNYFWELKRHLNDSPDCHIEVGFDEELAHLIYAGADMMIVPSLFEPCGLTQLIAMQYGTIPVVRSVGGLADTVFDKDYAHDKPLHERNGYVFKDYNNPGIESALSRAIGCYYGFPEHFRELMKNAMRYDYSWKYAGQHYLNIYDYIRDK
ncbi:MAG: glycogen synthase GlgA [Gammaproteobacteria bacterium]